MKKLNKKGFTLIELIVVIAILAILAAILIPAVTGYITKAENSKNQANCRALYSQLSMELMLDQPTLSYADGAVVGSLTLDYVPDATNNIMTSFQCTASTGTVSPIVIKTATP